jgi:hypothetical protein
MNHDVCDRCGQMTFLTWLGKKIFVCNACLDKDQAEVKK